MPKIKHWTNEEDQVLKKSVMSSPGNLTYAFKTASQNLKGRSYASCMSRWYGALQNGENIMAIATKDGNMLVNKKQLSVPKNKSLALEVIRKAITKLNKDQKLQIIELLIDSE